MELVYAPFLLIMMSWNAAMPDVSMQVSQRLLIDKTSCLARGEEVARQVTADREQRLREIGSPMIDGERFVFRCIEQPRDITIYTPPAQD